MKLHRLKIYRSEFFEKTNKLTAVSSRILADVGGKLKPLFRMARRVESSVMLFCQQWRYLWMVFLLQVSKWHLFETNVLHLNLFVIVPTLNNCPALTFALPRSLTMAAPSPRSQVARLLIPNARSHLVSLRWKTYNELCAFSNFTFICNGAA